MGLNKLTNPTSFVAIEESGLTLTLKVNGQIFYPQVPATARLIDILREELHLTGVKESCGIGRCGACSVFLDGRLVNACLVMAYQVDGKSVLTIEGIGTEGREIQKAFLEEGGFQCGYCTTGMIMAVKALIDAVPKPTEEDIKEALSGNLCRCTGYGGIIRAVQRLAEGND